jgi:beta,beta-carotene 9',10'-dioxygenase
MEMAMAAVPHALGFTSLDREVADVPLTVSGVLPDWLTGSLIRTAPARFEVGPDVYTHWFDGQAMLHAFAFDGRTVRYSNRFIRSQSYCEAERSGRIARGEFMTDPCRTIFGRIMALFNPEPTDNANVNISVLGDRLVALTETPMPIQFDAHTLETLGHLPLDPAVQGQVSTAHPHNDGERTYSYVIQMGRRSLYRLFVDENGRQRVLAEVGADRPAYMHSFGMSERFLILAEFPLRVHPLRLALSGKPFITNYRWHPELGTRFTVIDKESGAVAARAKAPPCFCFHHVNAFEQGGRLHLDLLTYPDASIIDRLRLEPLRAGKMSGATGTLTRFSLPLNGDGEAVEVTGTALCATPFELPRFDYARRAGRPYRHVWGVAQNDAAAFLNTIIKVDLNGSDGTQVRQWSAPDCYAGEPVFVARPGGLGEDDGVLLSVVLDAGERRSFLLVLDAATLDERARAVVPHHVPFGFHGAHLFDPDRPQAREATSAR